MNVHVGEKIIHVHWKRMPRGEGKTFKQISCLRILFYEMELKNFADGQRSISSHQRLFAHLIFAQHLCAMVTQQNLAVVIITKVRRMTQSTNQGKIL